MNREERQKVARELVKVAKELTASDEQAVKHFSKVASAELMKIGKAWDNINDAWETAHNMSDTLDMNDRFYLNQMSDLLGLAQYSLDEVGFNYSDAAQQVRRIKPKR